MKTKLTLSLYFLICFYFLYFITGEVIYTAATTFICIGIYYLFHEYTFFEAVKAKMLFILLLQILIAVQILLLSNTYILFYVLLSIPITIAFVESSKLYWGSVLSNLIIIGTTFSILFLSDIVRIIPIHNKEQLLIHAMMYLLVLLTSHQLHTTILTSRKRQKTISNSYEKQVADFRHDQTIINKKNNDLVSKHKNTELYLNSLSNNIQKINRLYTEVSSHFVQNQEVSKLTTEDLNESLKDLAKATEVYQELRNRMLSHKKKMAMSLQETTFDSNKIQQLESYLGNSMHYISQIQGAAATIESHMEEIKKLSAQNRILSVNASIHAKKSNEEGRGIASVAKEINTLQQDVLNTARNLSEELTSIKRGAEIIQEQHATFSSSVGSYKANAEKEEDIMKVAEGFFEEFLEDSQIHIELLIKTSSRIQQRMNHLKSNKDISEQTYQSILTLEGLLTEQLQLLHAIKAQD